MFMGIIHGQMIGITTILKHSYTSPHYNVLAGAFFVGRLFPPQVNTFQPLKQGHLFTQDTFSHPKYHSCVQQQIASVTKSCKFILLLITLLKHQYHLNIPNPYHFLNIGANWYTGTPYHSHDKTMITSL